MKAFISIVMGIIVLAVIAAFFMIGSPQKERLRRFDEMRQNQLANLQNEILNYRELHKGELPKSLDQLNSDFPGFRVPADPVTREPYGYEVKSTSTIQLCATFALPFEQDEKRAQLTAPYPIYGAEFWSHSAGHHCFTRTLPPYEPAPPVMGNVLPAKPIY